MDCHRGGLGGRQRAAQVVETQSDQGVGEEQGCCGPRPFAVCLVCSAVGGQAGRRAPLTPRCSARQMEAIGKLSDDMRRHFRMKLRNLFTKFIRKFGSVHPPEGGGPGRSWGGPSPSAVAERSYFRRALCGQHASAAPRCPAGLSW